MEREMTKSRKKFDAAFKAKIALEALRDDAAFAPGESASSTILCRSSTLLRHHLVSA
jgi:hypothetical protein